MEVESNVIKDEPSRRGRSAAGQHHSPRSSASNNKTIASTSSSNTTSTVTVKVGLNMNMCRLCLAEGSTNSRLQPVYYSKDAPDEPLIQKILELTTIQVTYATDFPSSICLGCKSKLEEYHMFRRRCIENDEILKLKYYELKTAEKYRHVHQQHHMQPTEDNKVGMEEYVDDGDDITLAIDESADVDEYQEETEEEHHQEQHQQTVMQQDPQVVEQQTIQYVSADGTMTEYIESGDVRVVSSTSQQQQIHIGGYSDAEGIQPTEGHEIYYTDGTDTYAIRTTAEGYVNAANYVPQGYDNQTEIECTTLEHLPEEEVYMDEGGGTAVGSVITPRGVHDRPFVCKHCKTSFKYEYNYERHMKNHAKVLYRCGKCSKTFTKQRKCQQHFLKAHSSQRYECDICFRTYSLPTRLENHVIEMHSENGVYKCDRCTETYTSYLDFKSHRNSHHSVNGSNATVITQAVDQRTVQSMHQVQSPQPHAMSHTVGTSLSTRSSVSDSCDFEVMIDETKIQKPGAPEETSDSKRPPATVLTNSDQDVILIDDETASHSVTAPVNQSKHVNPLITTTAVPSSSISSTSSSSIISSAALAATSPNNAPVAALASSNSTPSTVITTNGIDKNSLHRQLLQQIEESEANSTGPKIYKCDSCIKTFVHLNNLKAHIYAEHDNDKPFKCKLCPISFKTKEILVMHMVLHSQHNTAT
ncbi:zinc finger protein 236-like isoform X2 [Wyeomyia smithii]|uniref:zinc finger protein 236-like isoform X2 n=1 Tax=Wyeomyia smithii TaxID=174621 RepID=UPI00246821CF|nr:zinc finger protein 236-like isoform X2 [Wyeomyia smithii]